LHIFRCLGSFQPRFGSRPPLLEFFPPLFSVARSASLLLDPLFFLEQVENEAHLRTVARPLNRWQPVHGHETRVLRILNRIRSRTRIRRRFGYSFHRLTNLDYWKAIFVQELYRVGIGVIPH
jgi:hypothetical protein